MRGHYVSLAVEVDILKVCWMVAHLVLWNQAHLHDLEDADLCMEAGDPHSLIDSILAYCTCHEHSRKEVELVHWEGEAP